MVKYFILIKRKAAKNWLGAIPAKAGVSIAKLKSNIKKNLKKGFTYKIVSMSALKKYIGTRIKQKSTKKRKPTRKRRTVKRRRR